MKPKQHFIAVSTDEELPKEEDFYETDTGHIYFDIAEKKFGYYEEKYPGGPDDFIPVEVNLWLKPITPPTEEEIKVNAVEFANRGQFMSNFPHDWSSSHEGYIEGAKAILKLINGEKP